MDNTGYRPEGSKRRTFIEMVEGMTKKREENIKRAYVKNDIGAQKETFAYGFSATKYLWIIVIGSFIGFVVETVFCLLKPPHTFEMRVSLVFGPFVLIYGVGAALMTILFRRFYDKSSALIFFACAVAGCVIEYVMSYCQEIIFGTVSWEYSASRFHINGRTNIVYSVFWGLLGVLWIKEIFPRISNAIERIPMKTGRVITIVAIVVLSLDIVVSAGAVHRWSERVDGKQAQTYTQEIFDEYFDDEYMEVIYPNMIHLSNFSGAAGEKSLASSEHKI